MPKGFLLFVLMLALYLACGISGFSAPLKQTGLSMTIAPDKPMISAGAPLAFKVIFMNSGGKAVNLFTGANNTQAFTVSLIDSHFRTVCQNKESDQHGFSIAGRYEIAPGKTVEGMYLLNRWCSTLINPGQYTRRVLR
jgi:hypothetical protein